uniref:Putative secreted protein n=1 Tax=Anopheles darlingi TaxID=43151 RepID=A0A2M4D5U5_ANODA
MNRWPALVAAAPVPPAAPVPLSCPEGNSEVKVCARSDAVGRIMLHPTCSVHWAASCIVFSTTGPPARLRMRVLRLAKSRDPSTRPTCRGCMLFTIIAWSCSRSRFSDATAIHSASWLGG